MKDISRIFLFSSTKKYKNQEKKQKITLKKQIYK